LHYSPKEETALDLLDAPLATALSETLSRRRAERSWAWATALQNLCCLQGALSLLPMYRQVAHGIALRHDTVWQQTVQATQRRAREEKPRSPEAMTPAIFERTLAAATRRDELRHAMRWVTDSEVYRIIDEQLRDPTARVREHRTGLEDEGRQLIFDLRKVETPEDPSIL
jgi:hypothetical protein